MVQQNLEQYYLCYVGNTSKIDIIACNGYEFCNITLNISEFSTNEYDNCTIKNIEYDSCKFGTYRWTISQMDIIKQNLSKIDTNKLNGYKFGTIGCNVRKINIGR